MTDNIKKIVILGGGTAGWMAAASFASVLIPLGVEITLIESPDVSTVGVGEATIPPILDFIGLLGIDERDFIKKTNATFKLGIRFDNWKLEGHSFWHQFGAVGTNFDGLSFYQHWRRLKSDGLKAAFTDFSPSVAMAKRNKFVRVPPGDKSVLAGMGYALHFDASLVAAYLRTVSEKGGVRRIESHVSETILSEVDGSVEALRLSTGDLEVADFFIDCTGFRGLIIEDALKTGYDDWSNYLLCDKAVVAQTRLDHELYPFTIASAQDSGWQWKIPLQHRMGNGYVFCSKFSSDEVALAGFKSRLSDELITEPRFIGFKTGCRKKIWNKNCLSLGLASGFLEPLESTSIHLITKAIVKFLEMLPLKPINKATVDEYNRVLRAEYESIRDFIVLHYCTSKRADTDFWQHCAAMEVPDSLRRKLEIFRAQGRLSADPFDLFTANSWYAVLEGMGVEPIGTDPLVASSNFSEIKKLTAENLDLLDGIIELLPDHKTFISQHCASPR